MIADRLSEDDVAVIRERALVEEAVVARGVQLKKSGHELVACCPFHEDTTPSFRVHPSKNVWNCSPCEASGNKKSGEGDAIGFVQKFDRVDFWGAVKKLAVEQGIEVGPADRPVSSEGMQEVARYLYTDAAGVVWAMKKRLEHVPRQGKAKACLWFHSDGVTSGRPEPWQPTLYRYPDVVSAISEQTTIYLVEGEKCADALSKLGFTATCNEDGAGKWKDGHAEQLKDARVIILPDNDKQGRKHADAVLMSLAPHAAAAGIVELPGLGHGEDVVDWIAAGNDLVDLAEHIADALWKGSLVRASSDLARIGGTQARKWTRPIGKRAVDLARTPMTSVEWLVQGLLPARAVALLGGAPKGGKTWMETEIAIAVASGTHAFGEFRVHNPGTVLMLYLEDDERHLRNRFRALTVGRQIDFDAALGRIHYEARLSIDLKNNDDCAGIVASARALPEPPKLICIDPLRDASSGEENSNDDMRDVMHRIRAIRDVTGAAILINHHLSKPGDGKGGGNASIFDRFRGAGAIRGAYDAGIGIDSKRTPGTIKSKVEVELRGGRGAGVFGLQLDISDDDHGAAVSAGWAHFDDPKDMDDGDARGRQQQDKDDGKIRVLGVLRREYMRDRKAHEEPQGRTCPPIAKELSMAESTVRRWMGELENDGRITKLGRGWVYAPDGKEAREG